MLIKMNIKSKLLEYKRVLKITKKPDMEEYKMIVKVTGLGMAVIGFVGFLISMTFRFMKMGL